MLYQCSTVLFGGENGSFTQLPYTANRDKSVQDKESRALHGPETAEGISAGKTAELTAGWNGASCPVSHLSQKALIHDGRSEL